ncbi:serine hydrolase family protein [Candidatus Peregrinibacteria bacterium]|nr:serine hydrolase family protein [Candidatus Peregrinibacteria bacterium]MBI3816890.1 serine hydrolase family protein [Candidatus Peregrinibacteria bacterium]
MTVFLFHGIEGHPGENWFPWLKNELEGERREVIVPAFPNPHEPKLAEWLGAFALYENRLDGESILIGHSLGASFALHLLEHMKNPVCATFLISPVSLPTGNAFESRMKTFTETPYEWNMIRKNAGTVIIVHGDNDPYLRLTQAQELAETLKTALTVIRGGGHLNATAGFMTFPLLLEKIHETLS